MSSTRNGLVVIDDKPQKTTPFQKQLAAGEYNVAVELAEGAGTVRARARIEGGKKTKCKVEGNALSCASPQ